jgi:hypothetical protein
MDALCKESIALGHGLSFATGRVLVKQRIDDFNSPEEISRFCNVQGLDKNELCFGMEFQRGIEKAVASALANRV